MPVTAATRRAAEEIETLIRKPRLSPPFTSDVQISTGMAKDGFTQHIIFTRGRAEVRVDSTGWLVGGIEDHASILRYVIRHLGLETEQCR